MCSKVISVAGIQFLHKHIVILVCYFVTMVVNIVHTNLGVSQIYSLRKIVMRQKLDMAKDRKVQFGDYIKASKDADITNNMKSFTHKCIAVEPSEN